MNDQIITTRHAVQRAHERWPHLFNGDHPQICRLITLEIVDAIDNGRMAVNLPRFAVRAGCTLRPSATRQGRNGGRQQANRYTWTLAQDRVYVIRRRRNTTIVVTVIRPDRAETIAA